MKEAAFQEDLFTSSKWSEHNPPSASFFSLYNLFPPDSHLFI